MPYCVDCTPLEGIAELPEMNPAARAERSGHAAGERSIGHSDGGDGLL